MFNVTLILTRKPLNEFNYGARSGRWGTLAVVRGAKVLSAQFSSAILPMNLPFVRQPLAFAENLINVGRNVAQAAAAANKIIVPFAGRSLELSTQGGVELLAEFDAMERFRTDSNPKKFYMQVRPRPTQPYSLTMFSSTTVAELNTSGECLRVHGHGYKQQSSGSDAGILLHEAPHVGWLIGCISPREKNNRAQGSNPQPSRRAMDFIFKAMGGFGAGEKAELLVLDW